jgi:hypothetical protein
MIYNLVLTVFIHLTISSIITIDYYTILIDFEGDHIVLSAIQFIEIAETLQFSNSLTALHNFYKIQDHIKSYNEIAFKK